MKSPVKNHINPEILNSPLESPLESLLPTPHGGGHGAARAPRFSRAAHGAWNTSLADPPHPGWHNLAPIVTGME